jgi:large subunit ribosomal protein L6
LRNKKAKSKMRKDMTEKINTEGTETEVAKEGLVYLVRIKLNDKVLERRFKVGKKITMAKEGDNIIIKADNATKKEKRLVKTIKSHIKNMIKGLKEPWVYKLEVCFSHFPISVAIANKQLVIKNFFGERNPRYVKLLDGVDVEIKGNIIEVRSHDKELAGRQAALIEQATRITDKDRRIFQDGIWIIEKAGKPI